MLFPYRMAVDTFESVSFKRYAEPEKKLPCLMLVVKTQSAAADAVESQIKKAVYQTLIDAVPADASLPSDVPVEEVQISREQRHSKGDAVITVALCAPQDRLDALEQKLRITVYKTLLATLTALTHEDEVGARAGSRRTEQLVLRTE